MNRNVVIIYVRSNIYAVWFGNRNLLHIGNRTVERHSNTINHIASHCTEYMVLLELFAEKIRNPFDFADFSCHIGTRQHVLHMRNLGFVFPVLCEIG